jgi:hypothetical protein
MALPVNFYTSNRIINIARRDAGLQQKGDEADSEDLAEGINRLNELVLAAQTQGLKLWLQFLQAIPLVASQALYTITLGGNVNTNKPTRIIEGYFRDQFNNQRPLMPLSWNDWNRLSNKTSQGQINSYFIDKQAYQLHLWLWLVPDATAALGTAQMLIQQSQPTFSGLTDTMTFPPEWGLWLHWGLTDQLASGQPQTIMDRAEKKAAAAFEALCDWDVEDAPTQFQPDSRGGASYSKFK